MQHTTSKNAASTLLAVITLLSSFPAEAGEVEGNGLPRQDALQEAVACDWLVTKKLLAHQVRWECWEPATGYMRSAISATSVEDHEGNGLQSAFYALRSGLKVTVSKREWSWSEPVWMLDVVLGSSHMQAGAR